MGATPRTRTTFGDNLRAILDRNRVSGRKPDSIRSLARAMGNGDPTKVATSKRSLHKWIAGKPSPTRASRYLVAVALGEDSEVFEDEEEDDSEMSDLFHALMHSIEVVVGRKVDEQMRKAVA